MDCLRSTGPSRPTTGQWVWPDQTSADLWAALARRPLPTSEDGRFPGFSDGKSSIQLRAPVSAAGSVVDNGFAYRDSRGDPLKSSVP
jgi:hypothetical protein